MHIIMSNDYQRYLAALQEKGYAVSEALQERAQRTPEILACAVANLEAVTPTRRTPLVLKPLEVFPWLKKKTPPQVPNRDPDYRSRRRQQVVRQAKYQNRSWNGCISICCPCRNGFLRCNVIGSRREL